MPNFSWDNLYRDGWGSSVAPEHAVRFLAQEAKIQPKGKMRVLDLGCGLGATTFRAKLMGDAALGVDGSESAIERAKQGCYPEAFQVAKAESWPDVVRVWQPSVVIDNFSLYTLPPGLAEEIVATIAATLPQDGAFLTCWFGHGTRDERLTTGQRGAFRMVLESYLQLLMRDLNPQCDILHYTTHNKSREYYCHLVQGRKP